MEDTEFSLNALGKTAVKKKLLQNKGLISEKLIRATKKRTVFFVFFLGSWAFPSSGLGGSLH